MMKKGDVFLLNRLLVEMRKLADELEESLKKQDFEGVLKIKKQIFDLQLKVGGII